MTQVVWPPTCGQSTDVALVQKRLPGPALWGSQPRKKTAIPAIIIIIT